ncbi:ABC transporter substrate-binding protein [Sphingomonas sp. CGMCC 1.13654]|uniref:ABC transporter substrate-binding protein n=1 Tax=Sphingomonas chungangi TaxID=2683589 RepID=A0A838L6I1_9SPHN|nr:CmpA/NrtA family ABC transporter substrate-binding protein [Sphingomonas chungangi]MBA2934540.1 ABC transporter substrate-binding protein [Sphingomonas chungangi]MVW57579.1 nitrate transporter [Sphingomonas chungangi]
MTRISAAFLPLTDSAVLIAAREKGFAAEQDIALDLIRSESWATLRDRLVYGQVQAAHMLAPLAIAVTLGLSQHPAALSAPFKLSVNGNVFVMGTAFAAALDPDIARRIGDPIATAHDFAGAIGLYRRKPVIGIVHRFSCHALLLRYWLGYAGIDPDRDLVLRVLPPSLMGAALEAGEIDGFIAGEPWSTVAVQAGLAEIVMVGARVWQRGVEKVLAMRTGWMEDNAEVVDRLLLALDRAAAWCDDPAHHGELAELLSRPDYVGRPPEAILPTLTGRLVARPGDASVEVPATILFHREAVGFPWRSHALWIYSQLVRWGMAEPSPEAERQAADVFRSDIYRRALAGTGAPMPGASLKVEGALSEPMGVGSHSAGLVLGPDRFFDGRVFDPADIDGYLAAFRR